MQKANHQYRKWLFGSLCVLCATLSPLHAQETPPRPKGDWQVTRDRITEMRSQARRIRSDAEQIFIEAENRCLKKSGTVECRQKATKSLREAKLEAKRIEKEVQDLENGIKAEAREAKKMQKIEREKMHATAGSKYETQARQKREKEQLKLANRKPHNPNISNDTTKGLEPGQ